MRIDESVQMIRAVCGTCGQAALLRLTCTFKNERATADGLVVDAHASLQPEQCTCGGSWHGPGGPDGGGEPMPEIEETNRRVA